MISRTCTITRAAARLVGLVGLVGLGGLAGGCTAEARPGPPEPAPAETAAPAARSSADDTPTPACEPGSTKACVVREVTTDGYHYCHEDVALCRPDGLDWYTCGSWVKTDAGWRPLGPGRGM